MELNVLFVYLNFIAEGQYAFSCELLRTLRFIYEIQTAEDHPWRVCIDKILKKFLNDFKSI